jgi:hypothetical protein
MKRMSDELKGRVSDKQGEYPVLIVNLESILAQSRSVPGRPLLAPIYRWLGSRIQSGRYKLVHTI